MHDFMDAPVRIAGCFCAIQEDSSYHAAFFVRPDQEKGGVFITCESGGAGLEVELHTRWKERLKIKSRKKQP